MARTAKRRKRCSALARKQAATRPTVNRTPTPHGDEEDVYNLRYADEEAVYNLRYADEEDVYNLRYALGLTTQCRRQ